VPKPNFDSQDHLQSMAIVYFCNWRSTPLERERGELHKQKMFGIFWMHRHNILGCAISQNFVCNYDFETYIEIDNHQQKIHENIIVHMNI